ATPTFLPVAGTYTSAQSVTISTTTASASIYYTTDGTDPTIGSTLYTGAITISVTTTVKAIAIKSGLGNSAIGTAAYVISTIAATPTFAPVAGTYASAQSVTISCTTPGCHYHYTTNGVDPTESDPVASTVTVSTSLTLKAMACKTGCIDSGVGTAAYVIGGGDYPVNVSLAPTSGTLHTETKLTFTAVYSDSHGYSTLRSCYLLINPTTSCLKAAYVRYDPVTNRLYMRNDGNTSWMGGYAPGSNGSVANGYARIYCNETTVVKSANTITVTWKIALKSPYTLRPTCTGYMFCYNAAGNYAGWDAKGTYSVL
ncbi:MAG: chitobiase/beta-hexosaminidase C-terminal domain-containing protein, partial [Armatimonadetes bacterium]|nr:chitobiase/beta-hexosaminidase C-terminal domain-containing protein [Armatimonadota bacterium]